ncbi:MAG: DJ-1/PfpI family protein [Xanthomonadaceae bacterium]|jgi:transcriptional regulator GlxA family with amidase domain|nr:DJ-1/PfpI family protein [Xanthomonadaceae bacterium]
MQIAILLYPGFTATDAIGPYEVLSRLPGARTVFVAATPGPVTSDTGFLQVLAEPLSAAPAPAVVVAPGGPTARVPTGDVVVLDWLRAADRTSTWTTSVCTGALLLGAAGLLRGRKASTHWEDRDLLATHGATAVDARYVFDGKVVTAAGVSAGFDMALALAARIAGDRVAQAIQLGIEYDPQPPFDAGSPRTAPPEVLALVRSRARP